MLQVFRELIGQTIEAYVDDIIVKPRKANSHVADQDENFRSLRAKSIKLNPKNAFLEFPLACSLCPLSLSQ
jgi:hypothetical protein